jgi:hypothetical protein
MTSTASVASVSSQSQASAYSVFVEAESSSSAAAAATMGTIRIKKNTLGGAIFGFILLGAVVGILGFVAIAYCLYGGRVQPRGQNATN